MPLNKSSPQFVRVFVECWSDQNLHISGTRKTKAKFSSFVKDMKACGEYRHGTPTFNACYSFFLSLNPSKWSHLKHGKLEGVFLLCHRLFAEREDLEFNDNLLETHVKCHELDAESHQAAWDLMREFHMPQKQFSGMYGPAQMKRQKLRTLYHSQQEFRMEATKSLVNELCQVTEVFDTNYFETVGIYLQNAVRKINDCVSLLNCQSASSTE